MARKLLHIIGIVMASATFFGSGWWFSAHFGDRTPRGLAPTEAAESQSEDNEGDEDYDFFAISIPEYEQLQKAKWLSDLPPPFRSALFKGKADGLDSILYSEGMPEDLANVLAEEIALLSMGFQTIGHGIGENRWRSFNAGLHDGKRLRYLIYPTHIMVFSVFDKAGPPTRLTFGLALTGDGIKIVGKKYADMRTLDEAEQAGADQPATKPADKPPVKDQPSTSTSEDVPR